MLEQRQQHQGATIMANGTGTTYLPGGGEGKVKQWWGIYYGYVAVNADPLATGRVKARIPQVFGTQASGWASPMVPLTFVPEIGAPIAVMFVGGDPSQPVYFGNFAIPAPGTPAVVSPEPPANPSVGEIWYNSYSSGAAQGGNQMFVWNGQDTANQTLPTGQVIPNGWVAYNIGSSALATGIALSQPQVTGGTITGAQFIATGASGEILAYSGTPAAGNLVASVSAVAGTDAYGNAYKAGIVAYGIPGNSYIQAISGNPAFINLSTGVASEAQPGRLTTLTANSGATEILSTYVEAPRQSGQSASENAIMELISPSADLTSVPPSASLVAVDSTGATHGIQAVASSVAGNTVINAGQFGTNPSIFLDRANNKIVALTPICAAGASYSVAETWHPATLLNGWANGGGGLSGLQYKLMATGEVWIIGNVASGGSTSGQVMTLPAGYIPGFGLDIPVGGHTSSVAGVFLRVATSGAVTLVNSTTSTGVVVINARIPLDTTS
jgi:hypothetical protein